MNFFKKKPVTSGRSLRPGVLFFLTVLSALSACNETPPPATPAASCKTSKAETALVQQDSGFRLADDEKIDFTKDILPILSSGKDDEVYKCTSCHAAYTKEATFADKSKLDTVIDQVETLKMPLNGDEMRKDQIDLIKKWRDQMFPEGNEKPVVTPSDPAAKLDWEEQDRKKNEAKRPAAADAASPSDCSSRS